MYIHSKYFFKFFNKIKKFNLKIEKSIIIKKIFNLNKILTCFNKHKIFQITRIDVIREFFYLKQKN
jgi:hypothetical protein